MVVVIHNKWRKIVRMKNFAKFSKSATSIVACLIVVFLFAGCAYDSQSTYGGYFITPGLNDDRAQMIVNGMTAANVEATIGKPCRRVRFDNLKATAWDYRYVDTWGYTTDFAVMIGDDGLVAGRIAARVFAEDK